MQTYYIVFNVSNIMGDYRYHELSYIITSLISRTCCLCRYGSTYKVQIKDNYWA